MGHNAYKESCKIDTNLFTMSQFESTSSKRTRFMGSSFIENLVGTSPVFAVVKTTVSGGN